MKDRLYNFFAVSGEYAFYGLLFFIPISNALVESFAGLALFGFVGRKIIRPDFKFLKFWPNIFIIFFVFFCGLSFLNSGAYFSKSLNAFFGKWIQYLGICIIVQDTASQQGIFKRGMAVFLFGSTLAVLSGLSQYFLGFEFLRFRGIVKTNEGIRAITSSFVQNNGFGGYLVVVLSLLFSLFLLPGMSRLKSYGVLALAGLSTVAIFLTFSRGSWVGLTVASFLLAVLSRKDFKRLAPFFIVAAIVIFITPFFLERLRFTFGVTGDSNRFRYWLAALKMIKDHPFIGTGIGTFMANFPAYLPRITVSYAHNCYLQMWAETGIFSLFGFLAFICSIFYLSVKKFILSRDFFLLGLLAGVTGFLTHSFFESNLYSLRLAVLFWIWVGLIIARLRIKEGDLCKP